MWYALVAFGSIGLALDGTFNELYFVGAVIDMLIPTVAYFAIKGYKDRKEKMEKRNEA